MSKIEVTKIVFDTVSGWPELTLKDGSKRVIHLTATGNCWVESWVTPEQRTKYIKDAEERDKKWREEAVEKYAPKKKWWQR